VICQFVGVIFRVLISKISTFQKTNHCRHNEERGIFFLGGHDNSEDILHASYPEKEIPGIGQASMDKPTVLSILKISSSL
jgi:hypothetical protein